MSAKTLKRSKRNLTLSELFLRLESDVTLDIEWSQLNIDDILNYMTIATEFIIMILSFDVLSKLP